MRKAGSSSQSGSGNGGSGTAAAGGVGAGAGAGSGGNNARDVEGGRSGRLGLTSMEFPKSHRKAGHGHKLHVLKSGPKQLGEAGGVGVEVYFRDTCAMVRFLLSADACDTIPRLTAPRLHLVVMLLLLLRRGFSSLSWA